MNTTPNINQGVAGAIVGEGLGIRVLALFHAHHSVDISLTVGYTDSKNEDPIAL